MSFSVFSRWGFSDARRRQHQPLPRPASCRACVCPFAPAFYALSLGTSKASVMSPKSSSGRISDSTCFQFARTSHRWELPADTVTTHSGCFRPVWSHLAGFLARAEKRNARAVHSPIGPMPQPVAGGANCHPSAQGTVMLPAGTPGQAACHPRPCGLRVVGALAAPVVTCGRVTAAAVMTRGTLNGCRLVPLSPSGARVWRSS